MHKSETDLNDLLALLKSNPNAFQAAQDTRRLDLGLAMKGRISEDDEGEQLTVIQ